MCHDTRTMQRHHDALDNSQNVMVVWVGNEQQNGYVPTIHYGVFKSWRDAMKEVMRQVALNQSVIWSVDYHTHGHGRIIEQTYTLTGLQQYRIFVDTPATPH